MQSLINSVRRRERGAVQKKDTTALLPALPWAALLLRPGRSLVDASVQPRVPHRDCVTLERPCTSLHRCCSQSAQGRSDRAEKLQHGWVTGALQGWSSGAEGTRGEPQQAGVVHAPTWPCGSSTVI